MKKMLKLMFVVLMCTMSLSALAQTKTVSGTVVDNLGPVVGASVIEKGTQNGTTTGPDGNYSLTVPGGATLVVSSIGYVDVEITVGASSVYNVTLQEDKELLDEVVIVGYGSQKKVNLTGSVASITSESFEKRPIFSASTALQGMAPGVTVTTQSGAPGDDGGSIRIRGINSFGGSSTAPLVLIDGIEGSLDSIDPALIESISILKDAASSSIYGSRAANGVILVTTKRQSAEKFTLSYKGYVGWQSPTDLPEVVNAIEFKELTNAMNINDGVAPTYDEETMRLWYKNVGKDPDLYPDTDWQKAVLTGSGFMQNHTVSLGLGSESVKMLTTFGFSDRDGIIENTDYRRYSFRNNADVKFNDKLRMKLDISFSNGDRRYSPYQGTAFNYMNTRPSDMTNQFSTGLYNGLGMQGQNPIALLREGGLNKTNSINMSGAVTLIYDPVKWLTLQGMFAPRYATTNKHNWKKNVTTYQDPDGVASLTSAPFHTLEETASRVFYNNANFLAILHHNFGGHEMRLTLGAERNSYDSKYLSAYREDFNYPQYDQIDAGEILNMDNGGHQYQWAIQSFFGRLNWNYKDRYLLEANMRIDGSSRFTKQNRWGYFPSISGAWRISEEPWMKNVKKTVSMLKLRASYGTLGNQNLAGGDAASFYPTTQNLATGQISMNGNIYPLVTLNTMANSNIKWESTTMVDVGIDLGLFNHVNITADWYQKYTNDILMKLDIPSAIGLSAPYQNAGVVRNTGWEVGVAYNDNWGDFNFGVSANISDVVNEIVDMQGKTATSGVLRNQEGHSIGSIYALESYGIIRTQEEADWVNANCPQYGKTVHVGDIRYADISGPDGTPDGKIDDADKTFVGSTIPRFTYSTNLDFGWKGLNLSVLLQGVGKTDGYLNTYYVMPSHQGGTFRKEHLDHANAENPMGKTPRLTTETNNWLDSSFWMKSAAYLRIKNVQLSYTFPTKLVNKIGLAGASIYANAQNLFTFTNFWDGYDPEVGYGGSSNDFDTVSLGKAANYPQVKIFTMGLTLNF